MTRLGLSDSMRSTASTGDTGPLHTWKPRLFPLRWHAAASTEDANTPLGDNMTMKRLTSFAPLNPRRCLLGVGVAIIVLFSDFEVLSTYLGIGRSSTLQVVEQFDQLERSISLLARDTVQLTTTANGFLQHCKDAHMEAVSMAEMLQDAANISFAEEAKVQTEEHARVLREVLRYYAQQKQNIQETKNRLTEMKARVPFQNIVRPVHTVWYEKEQKSIENSVESDVANTIAYHIDETRHPDSSDYLRIRSTNTLVSTNVREASANRRTSVKQPTSYRPVFFYVAVAIASAVYLWNTIVDTEKKRVEDATWSWSPIPTVLSQVKKMVGALVVSACDVARRQVLSYRS
ncbi:unnamed protein product [Hyaloperonospora brassicae]|uniref:Transmembrane protein n=1 Tax=Hyaloperonospora brassicae TaxID=162125 RepID=A0AAV0T5E2_HYABA|nr:unnamed protein product [Hyaloperonospora brassicae]